MEGFDSIAKACVQHFETLFQEEKVIHLPEIMKIDGYYPTSISDEKNVELMKLVSLEEIKSILALSKNDKESGAIWNTCGGI